MLRALCFDKLRELFSAIPLSIAMTACVSNNNQALLYSGAESEKTKAGYARNPNFCFLLMKCVRKVPKRAMPATQK
jgi:hypothetical protein